MEKIQEYVLSFIFGTDLRRVWLVKKSKPKWQKGCLNGIGGKVEEFEEYKDAAIRELEEEGGVCFSSSSLKELGVMEGRNNDGTPFKVVIFTGISNIIMKTMEEEEIILMDIAEVKTHPHIENVPMLIESCLYHLSGSSNFSGVLMKYY